MERLQTFEATIRMAVFLGLLVSLGLLEVFLPKRSLRFGRRRRWPANLGITALDTILARILLPTTAVGFALFVQSREWGFFNLIRGPSWLEIFVSVLLLDCAIYGQHVLFHFFPPLWRLHRMHHTDLDVDVTTGIRFHPVEIIISFGIKFGVIVGIGASPISVLIFEILLNATSLFNHSNIRIAPRLERFLRMVVVTPDMHGVHHSNRPHETNSNFGFNLPWWDWVFRTYRPTPEAGHQKMVLGVSGFDGADAMRFDRLLIQPLKRPKQKPIQEE